MANNGGHLIGRRGKPSIKLESLESGWDYNFSKNFNDRHHKMSPEKRVILQVIFAVDYLNPVIHIYTY